MSVKIKPTLDDYIFAILDRDSGVPYPDVLARYNIRPNQFARAVNSFLEDYVKLARGKLHRTLKTIAKNPERRKELFNMGEEFIRQQYNRMYGTIPGETQPRFYEGTFFHPANINSLVYYTLVYHNPTLVPHNRKKVIRSIKNLPSNLTDYFRSIGLGGLMITFEKEERGSPWAVLEVFNRAYQRKTGNTSLFDLTQKEHLHKWCKDFKAPQSYWKNPINREEAVYHTLTEHHQLLISTNRKKVIEGIKNLPSGLTEYFHEIGLCGLIGALKKEERGSPLAILRIFDRAYQRKTGNTSLFDLTQKEHLHKWCKDFKAPQSYWKNPINREEAVYHTLTENHSVLASKNRKKVIEGIKNLPSNLKDHFCNLGLSGLMGKKSSPLAILGIFDIAYQRKTRNVSLFDLAQEEHLHKWGNNFQVPRSYWQNENNRKEAVYHTLTENHPLLAYTNRKKVIEGIKNLPHNLRGYFYVLFGGLMNTFKKGEKSRTLVVLEVFDKVYQRKTGDKSLFDKTQKDYLELNKKYNLVQFKR